MVSVYIHPLVDNVAARTVVGSESVSLKFGSGSSEITICGSAAQAEAFRMIADIFNDAFAPKLPISKAVDLLYPAQV